MSIRQIYNKQIETISDLNWVFTFGKYRGNSLEFVLELDCQYILYCQKNIDWFDVSYDILEQAEGRRDEAFESFTGGLF